ncbi:uncharacterized protein LOC112235739 isoform X2 [Oncorhynchus tshawytscha]|uniref:uncharacterized protein LOC112235739 isoform X2 n=1 Tax=Oncorhynchus tshawytscha TaxID=74940 RepID=UPI001C3D5F26|nr:uncharacterized protein LOC112235739 isoform X2 [Oncorhynchus tshawytscha]
MIMFILILCALSRETMVQTTAKKIFPAKIYWTSTGTIVEGSDLVVKCSTHGRKEDKVAYVYLCINGVAVEQKRTIQEDTSFTMKSVTGQQSGNYSCVFSKTQYPLSEMQGKGDNSLSIQVMDRILPADISLAGSRTVRKGDGVEFKCTISDPSFQTKNTSDLVHAYLCKYGSVVQIQVFDVKSTEVTFTIKSFNKNDAGNYSCVIDLQSKTLKDKDRTLYGNNAVFLQVNVSWSHLITLVFCVCFLLVLSLIVGIWWLFIKQGALQCYCGRTPQQEENDAPMTGEGDDGTSNMEEESSDEFACDSEASGEEYQNLEDTTYQEILFETRKIKHVLVRVQDAANKGPDAEDMYAKSCKKTGRHQYMP